MTEIENPDEAMRLKLVQETAKMPWLELQRFFAAGKVIQVGAELDLVEVAVQVANNGHQQIQAWMNAGQLAQVVDEQAGRWVQEGASVWAVAVAPWVLVQDLKQRRH